MRKLLKKKIKWIIKPVVVQKRKITSANKVLVFALSSFLYPSIAHTMEWNPKETEFIFPLRTLVPWRCSQFLYGP